MCVASGSGSSSQKDAPGNKWINQLAPAPAVSPPMPPPATALGVAAAPGTRRAGSDLEDQRRPLNPLGLPSTPRLGL